MLTSSGVPETMEAWVVNFTKNDEVGVISGGKFGASVECKLLLAQDIIVM